MPHRAFALALLFVALAAAPCGAGAIKGQLWLSKKAAGVAGKPAAVPAAASRTSGDGALQLANALRAQRGVNDAVVWIERIPEKVEKKLARGGFFARKARAKRMIQSKSRFEPRVLATPAGTIIELQNLDRVYHNAFSVSAAKRFDLGRYPPGRLDTLAFDRAGVVNLHCDIHPDEIGYVVVTPNHAYARPDSVGRFELPKLPAGSYRIRAWHPKRGEIAKTVEMPKRGHLALELAF